MNSKSIVLITVLFGLIVFGMFQYALLKNSEQITPPDETSVSIDNSNLDEDSQTPNESPRLDDDVEENPAAREPEVRINAVREFLGDSHVVTGTVLMPNPCYEIESEILIMESYPEQVQIRLNPTVTSEMCVQVVSEVPFSAEFIASEMASIAIMLDDEVLLNL